MNSSRSPLTTQSLRLSQFNQADSSGTKVPLRSNAGESNQTTSVAKLKQEVQQLWHKLRLRTKAVNVIQSKVQTKQDLEKVCQEIEKYIDKNEQLQATTDNLFKENAVLGQIIDRMKSKVQTKSGIAVDELETAFLDLNQEYEQYKQQNSQKGDSQQLNQQYSVEMHAMKQELAKLQNEVQDKNFRLYMLEEEITKIQNVASDYQNRCNFYKEKFMEEAKEGLRIKESFKQVVEDNKTHVQYIQVMERRTRELETQAKSDIDRMHKRINELRLRTIQETAFTMSSSGYDSQTMNLAVLMTELKEEQSTNADIKKQLQLLAEGKDNTQASLAMCRHNLLQVTMKLEEEARRVCTVERMRLNDLAENEKLHRMLEVNGISVN